MAAHAARTAPVPMPTPVRRPAPRPLLWLAVATALVVTALYAGPIADAAHAACTAGTEPDTTCAEALYLLGFPA